MVKALDALERKCGARRFRAIFKSITFDNGSEFSAAEVLERSAVNKTIPHQGILLPSVFLVGTGEQRERQQHDQAAASERHRFLQGQRGGDRGHGGMD